MLNQYMELRKKFHEEMTIRNDLIEKLENYNQNVKNLKWQIEAGKKVEIMFQEIAQKTQSNIEDHISNLVTLALKSVSPNFPNFIVKFGICRKQLEANLLFEKDGVVSNPLYCSGGGPKDIASFGLIIANWSMDSTRGTIILDEPFKQVSPDLQENVSKMIKMLNKELGIQFIMVSHAVDINVSADKTFIVEMKNGVSKIKEVI